MPTPRRNSHRGCSPARRETSPRPASGDAPGWAPYDRPPLKGGRLVDLVGKLAGCSGQFPQLARNGGISRKHTVAPDRGLTLQVRARFAGGPRRGSFRPEVAFLRTSGQTNEHENGTIQPNQILVCKLPDAFLQLRFGHRRDLVDHHMAGDLQSVLCRRRDGQTHQRRVRQVCRKRAQRDRRCSFEGIVLEDDCRPGLSYVIRTTGNGPDLRSLHSEFHSEIASTNACSSTSNRLAATSRDCRRASRANVREDTSGTQIWIGLSPRRRKRSR